jgi:ferritin-like protein
MFKVDQRETVTMLKIFTLSLLLYSIFGYAIERPPEADLADDSIASDEDVLVLDPLVVTGERLSLKQETRLRVIRQGFNEPRSSLKKDRDKLLCWLEAPVGSHFRHVICARNGDLDALRMSRMGGMAGYGQHRFWRSLRADNESTVRDIMNTLNETDYFDQEFITIASAGGQPPKDIPDLEELSQFTKAWIEVENLTKAGQPEDQVVAAITAEGLTLKRYNRLVELTQGYQSIRVKVTELVVETTQHGFIVGLQSLMLIS